MARHYKNYTDEDIIQFSKDVKSIAGLLKLLNLRCVGGNYLTIKKRLFELNVDCSHWTGKSWNKGEMLKDWGSYSHPKHFRKHFLKERNYTCESCGLKEWLNNPIPLEMHHKDGDRTNNSLDNLQCLCPNCHAQTDNFRNRNKYREGDSHPQSSKGEAF